MLRRRLRSSSCSVDEHDGVVALGAAHAALRPPLARLHPGVVPPHGADLGVAMVRAVHQAAVEIHNVHKSKCEQEIMTT